MASFLPGTYQVLRRLERMISHAIRWTGLTVLLSIGGCSGFVRDEVLDGPYRLVAVDLPEDIALCRSFGTKGDCFGDNLPGPTVFQAGWNSKYIVAARHPYRWPDKPNRSISEFYYVVRQPDEWNVVKQVSVVGPLNELEFEQEKRRLQLPEFSRVFNDLK